MHIHMPTQHRFLGINMTGLSEGNFFQRAIYEVANSFNIPFQYMMGRGVGDGSMRNLNGTATSTDEGVMAFGTLPLWFGGGGAGVAAKGEEMTVYRVFGGEARAEGFSWTTTHPNSVSNFRNVAGLPSGGASGATNTANFMLQGKVNVGNIIKSRRALPLDGNIGGLPEFIINPQNVRITNFLVLKP